MNLKMVFHVNYRQYTLTLQSIFIILKGSTATSLIQNSRESKVKRLSLTRSRGNNFNSDSRAFLIMKNVQRKNDC